MRVLFFLSCSYVVLVVVASWLDTLAFLHESTQHYEEAAQCRIHMVALVAAHLRELRPDEHVPIDEIALRQAAPNVMPEFVVAKNILQEEGVCESEFFSRAGLFRQLQEAARLLREDSLFESCIVIERLLATVYVRNREWAQYSMVSRKQASFFFFFLTIFFSKTMESLAKLCENVVQAEEEKSRMFSKFYRVVLVGSLFGPAPQKWIYKERPDVMISSMVDRLKAQFNGVTRNADFVHVLSPQDALPAAPEPNHVYMQVISVNPVGGDDCQNRVIQFMSESPFTKSGKVQGNWDEQCLRKVTMTAERSFPYLTKRLAIVKETTEELSPIQNALHVISKQVRVLQEQVSAPKPSLKTVQQVLQGSVLLQVNPGPIAICQVVFLSSLFFFFCCFFTQSFAKVFLSPTQVGQFDSNHVWNLRVAMSDLCFAARALLLLNGSMIDATQADFQAVLVCCGFFSLFVVCFFF